MNDTDRLEFLLRFISIDDVGDEFACPGVIVDQEDLEAALSSNPVADEQGRYANICNFGDNMRDAIDRAIQLNPSRQAEWYASCQRESVKTCSGRAFFRDGHWRSYRQE